MTTTYTVAGNTYPERRELKALGWHWDPSRKTWTGTQLSHQLRMAIRYRGLRLVSAPEIRYSARCGRYYRVLGNGMWRFVASGQVAVETPKMEMAGPASDPARESWRVWRHGGWELADHC